MSSSSSSSPPPISFFRWLSVLLLLLSVSIPSTSGYYGWINVKYKFTGPDRSLVNLKAHDTARIATRPLNLLAGVDLPLGGTGRADSVGLYYAKIGIGTPSRDYYVQVDTGSDIMWVNCIQCRECPTKSSLGIELSLYDVRNSLTGNLVPCNQTFCSEVNGGNPISGCTGNMTCTYFEVYGDGSSSAGYFVKDFVQYARVSGDLNTTAANGSIIFGCGGRQSGDLQSSEEALDGILGFGKANTSVISQLASTGQVKKMFAHCLDGVNGGGIFAIGHVVQPVVNTTALLRNQPHYSVNMTSVQVGNESLKVPMNVAEVENYKGAIIDSGTTLAYLPDVIYEPLISKIISEQSDLQVRIVQDQYTCFQFSDSVDDGFPNVTLHFDNSLFLKVLPHEYLFPMDDLWCMGWQNSGNQTRDKKDMILLGDLVLSNKLVLYDLEKQVIGWTDYNCSSNITVRDEQTGTVHMIGSHYLRSPSSSGPLYTRKVLVLLTVILLIQRMFY